MLNVVAPAYEAAGCQVIGTATSGQAARNLGDEAAIDNSRTIASLMWHLDHGRLCLDDRTLVVLDEAGMTDGPCSAIHARAPSFNAATFRRW
jgi:hypothetical protein